MAVVRWSALDRGRGADREAERPGHGMGVGRARLPHHDIRALGQSGSQRDPQRVGRALDGEHLALVDAFVVVVVDVRCAVRGRHGLGEPQRHRRRRRGDDRAGRRVRGPEARVGAGRAGRDEDDGKGQEGDERSAPTSSRAPSEAPARAGPAQRHRPRVGRELLRPGEIGAGRPRKAWPCCAAVGGGGPQGRSKVALRRWSDEKPAPGTAYGDAPSSSRCWSPSGWSSGAGTPVPSSPGRPTRWSSPWVGCRSG